MIDIEYIRNNYDMSEHERTELERAYKFYVNQRDRGYSQTEALKQVESSYGLSIRYVFEDNMKEKE